VARLVDGSPVVIFEEATCQSIFRLHGIYTRIRIGKFRKDWIQRGPDAGPSHDRPYAGPGLAAPRGKPEQGGRKSLCGLP